MNRANNKNLSNYTVSMTPSPNSNISPPINRNRRPHPKNNSVGNKYRPPLKNAATQTNNLPKNKKAINTKGNDSNTNNGKGTNKTNAKNMTGNNKAKNNSPLSLSTASKVILYLLVCIIIINILLIIYLNVVHRKNYTAVDAVVISGNCEDKENTLGMQKSKCKFKIKYDVLDADNKKMSLETEIIIKDKNKIRDIKGNQIIKIDVHPDELQKVKAQRDIPRDNVNLIFSLLFFILVSFLTYKFGMKNNLRFM